MKGRITVRKDRCQDLDQSSRLEWLETDGLGGMASGTVSGANTRRYHGLLVTSQTAPVRRQVLLSRVEESVTEGAVTRELGCAFYPDAVNPHGYRNLLGFELSPFPTWTYELPQGRLRKTVAMVHGLRGVILRYATASTKEPVTLRLRVFVAARDHHAVTQRNGQIRTDFQRQQTIVVYEPYPGVPPITFLLPEGAGVIPNGAWYLQNEYPVDRERGFPSREDIFVPFEIEYPLSPERPAELLVTIDALGSRPVAQLLAQEKTRRLALQLPGIPKTKESGRLARAADQFLATRPDGKTTVIAGHPWYAESGRDTFIALPGLCVATGRLTEARLALTTSLAHLRAGLLPNRFTESGDPDGYESADTTLWYAVALEHYLEAAGGDPALVAQIYAALAESLDRHITGTDLGIRVDQADGLLLAEEEGRALTWMDARIEDWVVTPRRGKPVEINALFYRALRLGEALAGRQQLDADASRFGAAARRIAESFERAFFDPRTGWLADVVREDGTRDLTLRPNQVIALALAPELVSREHARSALEHVRQKLLTPLGLRTLAPGEPSYQARYEGGPHQREGSSHNGTVRPFLVGSWGAAVLAVLGDTPAVRGRLTRRLASLLKQIETTGCLGSLPEMYDAEEPMLPRGCFAQAWSVAEAIRLYARLKGAGQRRNRAAGKNTLTPQPGPKTKPNTKPKTRPRPRAKGAATEARR